jgi:hypothetical protein
MSLTEQLIWLFTLAMPIACVAWTVTHEEVFKEIHESCVDRSEKNKTILGRKFFYLFTCEYCFSHYVTILFLFLTNFKLLIDDWRGYIIAGFALVFIANLYMSIYVRIKVEIKKERVLTQKEEEKLKS